MKAVKVKMDNLEAFLYVLLRDVITSGKAETIMEQHVEPAGREDGKVRYTNNYLYEHAKNLAERLRTKR